MERLVRFVAFAAALSVGTAGAYDWTVSVELKRVGNVSYRAFLWLPSSCAAGVRGLIMSSQVSSEWRFSRDPGIRAAAEAQQLAIVHFSPSSISLPAAADTAVILDALDKLAETSGFGELRFAPWVTFGHSTGCHFAVDIARWRPPQTFAVISCKGRIVEPGAWVKGTLAGIPVLALRGEYEEYDCVDPNQLDGCRDGYLQLRDSVLAYRGRDPSSYLMAPLMAVGEGHMAWSRRLGGLLGEFIAKAAAKRIPAAPGSGTAPVALVAIDASSGWLATTEIPEAVGSVHLVSAAGAANPSSRYWLIDQEFAEHWLAAHAGVDKQRQLVASSANKPSISPTPSSSLWFDTGAKLYKCGMRQGTDYQVSAASTSGLPVSSFVQAGPGDMEGMVVKINPCLVRDDATVRIILTQDGDATYKLGDRMIKASITGSSGSTAQSITMPAVTPSVAIDGAYTLSCTASSGLPVSYHVLSGPGELEGNVVTVKPFVSRTGTADIIVLVGQAGNGTYATAEVAEFRIEATGGITGTPGAHPPGRTDPGITSGYLRRAAVGRLPGSPPPGRVCHDVKGRRTQPTSVGVNVNDGKGRRKE